MKRLLACTMTMVAALSAGAQEGEAPPALPEPIELHVSPAAEPVPALKYDFRVPVLERKDGDAMPFYARAMLLMQDAGDRDAHISVRDWLQMPLDSLPVEPARRLLSRFDDALDYVEQGARRERCEWINRWRSEEPFAFQLPELGRCRRLGRVIALKARLEIADGDFEAACWTLRLGYRLADHVGESPVLINSLVAIAIVRMMNQQVEELLQAPDAPNLYWALAGAPDLKPGLCRAVEGEANNIFIAFPALRDPEKLLATPEQWQAAMKKFARLTGGQQDQAAPDWRTQLAVTAGAMKVYPEAKKYLLATGRPADEVEKMPVTLVCAIFMADTCRRYSDEAAKWFRLPYYQARPGLDGVERLIAESASDPASALVVMLFPALVNCYASVARLDRETAALLCVEAVRMYAAAHGGNLPESLQDMTLVPVPLDPMTGEPFEYRLEGETAVLYTPPESESRPQSGVHYRIRIRD